MPNDMTGVQISVTGKQAGTNLRKQARQRSRNKNKKIKFYCWNFQREHIETNAFSCCHGNEKDAVWFDFEEY